jgi:DNA-binding NarL/FixJ family response regulator
VPSWCCALATWLLITMAARETPCWLSNPAQPSAIAPIVVEAYDLTPREEEIISLIARGAAEISRTTTEQPES